MQWMVFALAALSPVPPSADVFMWQGQQTLLDQPGGTCNARIALGVGDQAVCFAAADDTLKCAGRVYATTFGPTFVTVPDRVGVEQVFVSLTANSETGNALCVRQGDGTAWCMGNYNDWGQFGSGSTGPSRTFVQWGGLSNLVAIGTGTWDQMCALDSGGDVLCSGFGFGTSPASQGTSSTDRFWVTTFGTVSIDDPAVFRASDSRTECQVVSSGLSCGKSTLGAPGRVVMGGMVSGLPDGTPSNGFCGFFQPPCWLDVSGSVVCAYCDDFDHVHRKGFLAPRKVLALAFNFYGDNLCGVYEDGSLWCLGSNAQGMLGAGDMVPHTTPVMVQPPGSVRIECN